MSSLLRYEHFSFQYKNADRTALEGFDLDVGEGEVVLITGASGAGKTTVCRAANGLIPHLYGGRLEGRVVVADRYDTREYDVASLSRLIGLLFQDPDTQLLMPTVEEELGYGPANYGVPREEIFRRIDDLLRLIRLQGARHKNPHSLSGGQQQAVALAAVLAMDPGVLVLDEPTSNIDPLGSQELLALVARLAREQRRTVVVVEHKLEELAGLADRMLVLDGGRVVASGTPDEVLEDVELIDRLGLHAPEVTLLCQRLRNLGVPIDRLPLTVDEGVEVLGSLLRETANASTPSPAGGPDPAPSPGEPVIEVEDVSYRYPDGTEALRGVSLTIREGEFVAVLGQNGSGKTTLMKHFNGLLRPSAGRVRVAGRDTARASIDELARVVGYIFQDPTSQIFKMKVRDELAFGPATLGLPADEVTRRVERAAEQLGIAHLLDQNPFFLSKGEQQRVAVAAVMAMEPRVLVLDEPTTGQDYRRSREILELCVELNRQGTTVVMITHDMKLAARYARRVVVLREGEVLADGPTREVFAREDVLTASYLKPPQVTTLCRRLGLPHTVLTVDEALAALRPLLLPGGVRSGD